MRVNVFFIFDMLFTVHSAPSDYERKSFTLVATVTFISTGQPKVKRIKHMNIGITDFLTRI